MRVRADLHTHTVLSPCAEVEMIPPLIVERALDAGLDLIAVTDHNASANAGAVIQAARGTGLRVLPGLELKTREEVHLLCLFDSVQALGVWQEQVDAAMPNLPNRPETFGEQFVVDAAGDFVRREERLLLAATRLTLEDAIARVTVLGGMPIPAHIDRTANGLLPILGFVPYGLAVPALELSASTCAEEARRRWNIPDGYPLIQSSDAHWLDAMATVWTEFDLEGPRNLAGLAEALREKRYTTGKL